jgi:hypothetical protein
MLALAAAAVIYQVIPAPAKGPVDPSIIARASAKWVGKKVWVLGASCFATKNQSETWSPLLPAVVTAVDGNPDNLSPPRWTAAWPDDWAYDFKPGITYRLILKLPKMAFHRSPSTVSDCPDYHPPFTGKDRVVWTYKTADGISHKSIGSVRAADTEGFIFFGNLNEAGKQITTIDPKTPLRHERSSIKKAFAEHRIVLGMTHALVARVVGFPNVSETLDQLWHDQMWEFSGMTPGRDDYIFGANGRLTAIDQGPMLP